MRYLTLGMISGLLPDIDILLGGFHGINIDTTIFVFPADFITQITAEFNISDYLDNGIFDIEHRGITHSGDFFLIGLIILLIISIFGIALRKIDVTSALLILVIIECSWFSHLFADFNLKSIQGNGIEVVMTVILWFKYHEDVGIWIEKQNQREDSRIKRIFRLKKAVTGVIYD